MISTYSPTGVRGLPNNGFTTNGKVPSENQLEHEMIHIKFSNPLRNNANVEQRYNFVGGRVITSESASNSREGSRVLGNGDKSARSSLFSNLSPIQFINKQNQPTVFNFPHFNTFDNTHLHSQFGQESIQDGADSKNVILENKLLSKGEETEKVRNFNNFPIENELFQSIYNGTLSDLGAFHDVKPENFIFKTPLQTTFAQPSSLNINPSTSFSTTFNEIGHHASQAPIFAQISRQSVPPPPPLFIPDDFFPQDTSNVSPNNNQPNFNGGSAFDPNSFLRPGILPTDSTTSNPRPAPGSSTQFGQSFPDFGPNSVIGDVSTLPFDPTFPGPPGPKRYQPPVGGGCIAFTGERGK